MTPFLDRMTAAALFLALLVACAGPSAGDEIVFLGHAKTLYAKHQNFTQITRDFPCNTDAHQQWRVIHSTRLDNVAQFEELIGFAAAEIENNTGHPVNALLAIVAGTTRETVPTSSTVVAHMSDRVSTNWTPGNYPPDGGNHYAPLRKDGSFTALRAYETLYVNAVVRIISSRCGAQKWLRVGSNNGPASGMPGNMSRLVVYRYR